ncbi:MAG: Trx7/PDZ domain-containing (seleno)protein [Planctomycetaceae bacterium]
MGFVRQSSWVSLLSLAAMLVCDCGESVAAPPNERARKVLDDKAKVTSEGFWIYGDLPAAYRLAEQTGKPLLVVLRCLPCVECVKLDDDVVDRDPVLRPLLEQFVCVRVVSTNGLDLSLFQFDTDQSFAAFMLRDARTIYGRFGTRSHRTDWLGDVSVPGFAEALKGALELHAAWPQDQRALQAKIGPKPAVARPELFPSLKEKYAYTSSIDYEGDVVRSCIHCHQIGDAVRDEFRARGETIPEQLIYPYPHPKSIGVVLDPKTRATIVSVEAQSPAGRAGLKAGDKITKINGQPILSMADVQWVLHQASPAGATLELAVERDQKSVSIPLPLEQGWRRSSDISWRVSAWGYARMALGGMRLEPLTAEQRGALTFDPGPMALRVRTVGQYGPHATAKKVGFQVDDVLVSIDKRTDFQTEADVMRYGVGEKGSGSLAIELYRGGKRKVLELPLQK